MRDERFAKTQFAAWIGIAGNLILAAVKGVIGYLANSKALIADALHSASDVVGSVAVLIGLRTAQLPPDEDHPYGHGKAEPIAAIIVAMLLFVVGIEMGNASVRALFTGEALRAPGTLAVYAAVLSIVVKEGMFRYKYRLGKKYKSDAIIANAYEHRSDVFSSLAALFGIGAAIIGQAWNIPFLIYFDPLAGVAVSLLILKMAYRILRESIHNTMDHVLHEEEASELKDAVQRVRGVIRVDELRAREHGHYVIVDVKIAVDPMKTVEEGHDIGKAVKEHLIGTFSYVRDVLVHVNPYESPYPYRPPDEGEDYSGKLLH